MTDVSVVVVSWNSRPYLEACLASVLAGGGPSREVFLVDNASSDGSADLARERFPGVAVIENAENRGFAAANNQAFRAARGRYVFLLNPDTRVEEGAIGRLVRFMDEHPAAGACGPLLVGEGGRVEHAARRFPTFAAALGARTPLGRLGLFRRACDEVRMRAVDFGAVTEVDQPSGAALFIRREALDEAGPLDERFFMFFEEVDLCRRLRDAGWIIFLLPEARVTHYGGRSRRQARARIIRVRAESMIRYFRKHEGGARAALFELAFRPLFALDVCIEAAGAAWKAAAGRLRGRGNARAMDVLRADCSFIRRDLLPFLLGLWE
ncbi:MAG: glycosyltransferase family 2 protein [bacterium]|nr:glycosyltransferase family 2 protein [bacterium]